MKLMLLWFYIHFHNWFLAEKNSTVAEFYTLYLHAYYNFSTSIAGRRGIRKSGGLIKLIARAASWDINEDEVIEEVGWGCFSQLLSLECNGSVPSLENPFDRWSQRSIDFVALNSGWCSSQWVLQSYFFWYAVELTFPGQVSWLLWLGFSWKGLTHSQGNFGTPQTGVFRIRDFVAPAVLTLTVRSSLGWVGWCSPALKRATGISQSTSSKEVSSRINFHS